MFRFVAEKADDKGMKIEATISGGHANVDFIQALYGIAEAIAMATNKTPIFVINSLMLVADILEENPDAIKKECTEIKLPKGFTNKQ